MTVYTKTWKKKQAAVSSATKNRNNLTDKEAKLIQQKKNYDATIKAAQTGQVDIEKALNYTWKVVKKKDKKGKETKKKVYTKRKKPAKPSKEQAKNLANYKKQEADATAKRKKLVNSAAYKKADKKKKAANDKLKAAKTNLANYQKKRHQKAVQRIAKQQQQNYERFMAPHASIYAHNSLTGLTVFLFAQSEEESNSSDATSYPIDNDDPVTDHVRRTGKTLTVSGFLYGQKAAERLWAGTKNDVSGAGLPQKSPQQQYRDLIKWQFDGVELEYKSNYTDESKDLKMNHIYYKHLFMTELSKPLSGDKAYSDMMPISMTFQFAYKAKVATGNKNNKGKKGAKGSYIGAKKVKVKKGDTYAKLAKKYGTNVKQLTKWNGSEKKALKVGSRVQVTQGALLTKTKNATQISKINQGNWSAINSKIKKVLGNSVSWDKSKKGK